MSRRSRDRSLPPGGVRWRRAAGLLVLAVALARPSCTCEKSTWVEYCMGENCDCEENGDCVIVPCAFEPALNFCGCCGSCDNGEPIRRDVWEVWEQEWVDLCGHTMCNHPESGNDCGPGSYSVFEPVCVGGTCAGVLADTR